MPRNLRNKYIEVPFEKDGRTLAALEADAKRHNVVNRLGVMAALRLGEYYEAVEEGRILPKGMIYSGGLMQMPQQIPTFPFPAWNGNHPQPVAPPVPHAPVPEVNVSELERLQNRPAVIEESTDIGDEDFGYFDED